MLGQQQIEHGYEINHPMIDADIKNYDVTPGDVHIDRPISNILLEYRPENFVADQIAPIVTVGKQSDLVPGYNAAQNLREEETTRAPGTLPRYIFPDVTSLQYYANPYFLGTWLTQEELASDDAWNIAQGKSNFIWDVLMVGYEIRVAAMATNSANMGGGTDTSSAWTSRAGANALDDCIADIEACSDLSGFKPNTAIFGHDAWRWFRINDQVRAILFPHGGGLAVEDQAAKLLGVDRVIVAGAYKNTAAQAATASLSRIWAGHVTYAHIAKKPAKWTKSWAYGFRWNVPGTPSVAVRRFPFDGKRMRQDMHVGYYQDEKVLDANLAYCRWNVMSST